MYAILVTRCRLWNSELGSGSYSKLFVGRSLALRENGRIAVRYLTCLGIEKMTNTKLGQNLSKWEDPEITQDSSSRSQAW